MKVDTYSKTGSKSSSSTDLPKAVFDEKVDNHDLLNLAYNKYLAQSRNSGAKTLTRGLVRGGGRKPWRQKGTGRARAGSIRSPIWRTGGITFGPTGEENHKLSLPKQSKRKAIRQALSLAHQNGSVVVIDTFECKDGKTKETAQLLAKLGADRNTLLVVSEKDELVDRATRNIQGLKAVQANYVNVYDVLNADKIVVSKKSIELIEKWLGV